MRKDSTRQIVNVVAVIATLVVNGLANALPFNGRSTGAISDSFHVYFVPAGYVFAIWGVIYIGLLAFAVFQALPSQAANPRLRRVGYLFALSCLLNMAWLFLWHYEQFLLTIVVMLLLLLSLIAIYLLLGIGRGQVSRAEAWCVRATFSVYLGWITVATLANATDVLNYLGWNGAGLQPALWAAILLLVAAAITVAVIFTRGDVGYTLVIVWAYIGIAVKQAATSLVAVTAAVLVVAIVAALVLGLRRRWAAGRHAPAS